MLLLLLQLLLLLSFTITKTSKKNLCESDRKTQNHLLKKGRTKNQVLERVRGEGGLDEEDVEEGNIHSLWREISLIAILLIWWICCVIAQILLLIIVLWLRFAEIPLRMICGWCGRLLHVKFKLLLLVHAQIRVCKEKRCYAQIFLAKIRTLTRS